MGTITSKPPSPPPATEGFWLSQLTSKEKSALIATFGGWALDGMDVMVYSFVIPSLIAAWHISKSDAGWPLRTRKSPADHYCLVCRVYLLERLYAGFLATAPLPRVARFGIRWRVGSRLGADG